MDNNLLTNNSVKWLLKVKVGGTVNKDGTEMVRYKYFEGGKPLKRRKRVEKERLYLGFKKISIKGNMIYDMEWADAMLGNKV